MYLQNILFKVTIVERKKRPLIISVGSIEENNIKVNEEDKSEVYNSNFSEKSKEMTNGGLNIRFANSVNASKQNNN